MNKARTPEYRRWKRIVEGQIRSAIYDHPEWFCADKSKHQQLIESVGKRIVGEIISVALKSAG